MCNNRISKLLLEEYSSTVDEEIKEEKTDVFGQVKEREQALKHISRGGLRGLQVLSLSECRNVTDMGMRKLTELRYLRKLNVLGCIKIEDEGVKSIGANFPYLEELDLGGTSTTINGLQELVNNAKHLKSVFIKGCKRLNVSDDQILLRRKISCTPVEDTFRFHLMPELSQSDLPPITRSVLKTRSTLGLNKVYKYLFKRLISLNVENL